MIPPTLAWHRDPQGKPASGDLGVYLPVTVFPNPQPMRPPRSPRVVLSLPVTGESQPKARGELSFIWEGLANGTGLWVELGCSRELCPGPVPARRKLLFPKIHPGLSQLVPSEG